MSERTTVLPCFRCGRIPEQDDDEMLKATAFTSRGGYGSTYDPMVARAWLRINICDNCLEWGAEQRFILEGLARPVSDVSFSYWGSRGK